MNSDKGNKCHLIWPKFMQSCTIKRRKMVRLKCHLGFGLCIFFIVNELDLNDKLHFEVWGKQKLGFLQNDLYVERRRDSLISPHFISVSAFAEHYDSISV